MVVKIFLISMMSSSLIPALPTGGRPLPTKVVVRLLPPSLTEEEFMKSIPDKWEEEIDYKKFSNGVYHESPTVETPNVNSFCYLNFKSFRSASEFVQKFHGTVFESPGTDGETFRAVAAIAPFQRVPRPWKCMKNLLQNTIEEDAEYKQFLANQTDSSRGIPVSSYTFDHEKSEQFISPLVKSLSERSERINEALKRTRDQHKKKGGKKTEGTVEELKPISVKAPRAVSKKKSAQKGVDDKGRKNFSIMKRAAEPQPASDSWS